MATAAVPTLAERADIHKSCKSLETLLSVVNDYCEATSAVVMLQKKLAKALKETAGLKVTADIPANAIIVTANVFEALSEINAKFAKIIDKECDVISGDVQKWFKKLAKEEKIHDEKMEKTNLRIKQAGQLYEKKSKKNPREAVEEHARYINLLSTLGPEVSHEKYNHAFQVTQRHRATTYNVAGFVSRMADAEWLRTCEAVRRFATPIGQLGEWRALCEGGWTGTIPQDLPLLDGSLQASDGEKVSSSSRPQGEDKLASAVIKNRGAETPRRDGVEQGRPEGRSAGVNTNNGQRELEYAFSTVRTTLTQQHIRSSRSNTEPSSEQSQSASSASFELQHNPPSDLERGRRSPDPNSTLESFPAPPTHLPLPPSHPPPIRQQTSRASSVSPQLPRLAESPIEDDLEQTKYPLEKDKPFISPGPSASQTQLSDEPYSPESITAASRDMSQAEFGVQRSANTYSKGDYFPERHDYDASTARGESHAQVQSINMDTRERLHGVEGIDTGGSSGSIVAAMRRRYSQQSGTVSPTPKDVPRLPMSVTDLASRYQPLDGPPSPHQRTFSPPSGRQLPIPPSDTQYRHEESSYQGHNERNPPPGTYSSPERPIASRPAPPVDYDLHSQRRRLDEQAERDIREKEKELQVKEREIAMRVRELDIERAQLTNERFDMYGNDSGSQRAVSQPFPTLRSQIEFPVTSSDSDRPRHMYDNNNHLLPPPDLQSPRSQASQEISSPRPRHHSLSQGQPPSRSRPPSEERRDHASYCGCDQCSVSKYKTQSSTSVATSLGLPQRLPEQLRPQPEKSKSWMRRLSMPVGVSNAFSLDSKKSSGALRNLNALEDGRLDRRNYEANAVSNRSLTNLGRR